MQAKPTNWQTLLEMHLQWYPLMQLRDVYKLIYQGVMGAEHLMPSREEYTRYLMDEFQSLVPDPAERLLEPLRPDGALYRLNLRPLKALQLGLDRLISYLLDTADVIKGDRAELLEAWAEFTQLCMQGQFHQYDPASIEQFSQWLEQVEYPAIHHSEVYNRAYQPAYRLIAAKFFDELGLAGNLLGWE